jgi:hypothetical protein
MGSSPVTGDIMAFTGIPLATIQHPEISIYKVTNEEGVAQDRTAGAVFILGPDPN